MRKTTGYKSYSFIEQYFIDDGSTVGEIYPLSGSSPLNLCGNLFSSSFSSSFSTSGRFVECLFDSEYNSGNSNPFLFITSSSLYNKPEPNNFWINGINTTSALTNVSSTPITGSNFYTSSVTTLTPLPDNFYGQNNMWFQITGGLGNIFNLGLYNNLENSLWVEPTGGFTASFTVSYASNTFTIPTNNTELYHLTVNTTNTITVNFHRTGGTGGLMIILLYRNGILVDNFTGDGTTVTGEFEIDSNLLIWGLKAYLWNPSNGTPF